MTEHEQPEPSTGTIDAVSANPTAESHGEHSTMLHGAWGHLPHPIHEQVSEEVHENRAALLSHWSDDGPQPGPTPDSSKQGYHHKKSTRQAKSPVEKEMEEKAKKDPEYAKKLAVARSLIKLGGHADKSDGPLVVAEMMKMPKEALDILAEKKSRVVVCRDNVTDYKKDLKGVRPRGWPPGATWDNVPGANLQGDNEVVVAITGHGTKEGAHVPKTGEKHGSANLVIHEIMHAVDLNARKPGEKARSDSEDFTKARTSDASKLSAYENQAGDAGRQESYAETAARYYGADKKGKEQMKKELPHLFQFWDANPLKAHTAAPKPAKK